MRELIDRYILLPHPGAGYYREIPSFRHERRVLPEEDAPEFPGTDNQPNRAHRRSNCSITVTPALLNNADP
jgi:hypothetical protein